MESESDLFVNEICGVWVDMGSWEATDRPEEKNSFLTGWSLSIIILVYF